MVGDRLQGDRIFAAHFVGGGVQVFNSWGEVYDPVQVFPSRCCALPNYEHIGPPLHSSVRTDFTQCFSMQIPFGDSVA